MMQPRAGQGGRRVMVLVGQDDCVFEAVSNVVLAGGIAVDLDLDGGLGPGRQVSVAV